MFKIIKPTKMKLHFKSEIKINTNILIFYFIIYDIFFILFTLFFMQTKQMLTNLTEHETPLSKLDKRRHLITKYKLMCVHI